MLKNHKSIIQVELARSSFKNKNRIIINKTKTTSSLFIIQ